jgi:hypothetical protein
MSRIRAFVIDIHRRSLWQVMAVYLAASWFVLQVSEHVVERFLLPEWVYGAAVLLLLIGLPIVLATALVREEPVGAAGRSDGSKEGGREFSFGPAGGEPSSEGDRAASPSAGAVGSASAEPTGPAPARTTGVETAAAPASSFWGGLNRRLRSSPLRTLLTWPRALAGGIAAFSVLALVGGFFYLEGVPRITEARGSAGDAFQERSWILVADFEVTGEEDRGVALAVREALTVDLQQSEHVNVLARSQVGGVLRRMDLPETSALDVPLALEVAERFGAGAVLTATISRLGPQYVVSGRALRSGSGEELFAVRVAASEARLLEGVESLSREVRRRLGETRGMIRASLPLPEVTTGSLDALKAYAEAEHAISVGEPDQAAVLAAEAVRLDPSFAMAHRLAAVSAFNLGRQGDGRTHAARAYEFRDRLSDRERWHVEAFYHLLVDLDARPTVELYELILSRYPDDFTAANNLGTALFTWMSDEEGAAVWFERAREIDPNSPLSRANLIEPYGLTGRLDDVDRTLEALEELGASETVVRFRVRERFARGDLERVQVLCDSILAGPPRLIQFTDDRELCGSMDLAMGRFGAARSELEEVTRSYLARGHTVRAFHVVFALAEMDRMWGNPEAATRRMEAFLDELDVDDLPEPDRYFIRTYLQVHGLLDGRPEFAARVGERLPPYPEPDHWVRRQGGSLVEAARAAADDRGVEALELIRSGDVLGQRPIQWSLTRRLITARAHRAAGDAHSEASLLGEMVESGRVAFAGPASVRALLPGFLLRLAEVEEERGDLSAAAGHYRRLLALWAGADPQLAPRVREVEQALGRLEAQQAAG